MNGWEALVLGVVQGATEFLPISSSGHLVMLQVLLDVNVPGMLFEVTVHVATLISIIAVYRGRVVDLVRGSLARDGDALEYVALVVIATIPAGVLGLAVKDRVEALFDNPYVPGIALLVTGAFLWSTRATLSRARDARPSKGAALLIGCAQAFALVPGISRSGATVVAALWLGLEAREAAAFSFLIAVPAITGAAILQITDLTGVGDPSLAALAVGSVTAAVIGVLAIRTFVAMLVRRSFHLFAPYCWLVGVGYLMLLAMR